MLLRFHPMTRDRFRAVEASAERLELGELEFALAGKIRDHLTLVHAIETGHPLVAAEIPGAAPFASSVRSTTNSGRSPRSRSRPPRSRSSPPASRSRAVRLAAAAFAAHLFRGTRHNTDTDRQGRDGVRPSVLRGGDPCPRGTPRTRRELRRASRRGTARPADEDVRRVARRLVRGAKATFTSQAQFRSSLLASLRRDEPLATIGGRRLCRLLLDVPG